ARSVPDASWFRRYRQLATSRPLLLRSGCTMIALAFLPARGLSARSESLAGARLASFRNHDAIVTGGSGAGLSRASRYPTLIRPRHYCAIPAAVAVTSYGWGRRPCGAARRRIQGVA